MASTITRPLLYITDSTGYGGAEKYLLDVMSHFKKSAPIKLLLLGEGNAELIKQVQELDIEIIRFPNPSLARLPKLIKALSTYRSWFWHVNLTYYDSCRYVQLASFVFPQTRVVATLHTLATIDRIEGWRVLKRWLRQKVFNHFDLVIAPSQFIASRLAQERYMPTAKISIIYNGVKFNSALNMSPPKPNVTPEILIAARLHPDKGHKYLFEALAKLHRENVKFSCQVVGEGPIEDELKLQVEQLGLTNNVHFLGFRNDVPKMLRHTDVLVLPSLPESENFPLIVLEAMAASVPVIATKVGGVPEQIIDGKTGLLIDPGNSGQLAKELSKVLSNRESARRMGHVGSQRYEAMFTLRSMNDQLEQLYKGLP